jgi:molybdopterin-guanine dinucleotide biosynthesis protein A
MRSTKPCCSRNSLVWNPSDDERQYQGPAPALHHGLQVATNQIVFACSCDLPLLRGEVAKALCDRIGAFDASIPKVGAKLQPLCAAYRRDAALEALAKMSAAHQSRMTQIIDYLSAQIVEEPKLREIDPELTSFINVNTPADYERALAIAMLK